MKRASYEASHYAVFSSLLPHHFLLGPNLWTDPMRQKWAPEFVLQSNVHIDC